MSNMYQLDKTVNMSHSPVSNTTATDTSNCSPVSVVEICNIPQFAVTTVTDSEDPSQTSAVVGRQDGILISLECT